MAELLREVFAADYHADKLPGAPHFSRSVAVTILQGSARKAYALHPKLGGAPVEEVFDDPQKQARLEFGGLVHHLLLGGGRDVAVCDYKDWRTDASKAARDLARQNGLTPVLAGKHQRAVEVANAIRLRLEEEGLALDPGFCELTALWEDQGVDCKARLDYFDQKGFMRGSGLILDVKVSEQTVGAFRRSLSYTGLDIQAHAYTSAIGALFPELAGRVQFVFALCEPSPPFEVALIPAGPSLVDLGRQSWNRALKIWKAGIQTGNWPGLGWQEPAEASEWALKEAFEKELAAVGEQGWTKGI